MKYLTTLPQWVPVLLTWDAAKNKHNKLPCDPRTGLPSDAHLPSNWLTYQAALRLTAGWGPTYTIGFVLTDRDDVFCVDIDHALTPTGWSPLAQRIASSLPGCYIETSLSGNGLHVWGRYASPPPHRKKRVDLDVECYTTRRFIAIGKPLQGEISDRCEAFPQFVAEYFALPPGAVHDIPDEGPRVDWRGPIDDEELLRRAMRSRSAAATFDPSHAAFADLWTADEAVLGRAYPHREKPYDPSSADMALASHLAFWTGCDVARCERLMRRSALAREKWDREDYLVGRTIMGACAGRKDVLCDPEPQPGPAPALPTTLTSADLPTATPAAQCAMAPVSGSTFLDPAAQSTLFHGCAYIADYHRVMVPGGRLYKPDQFKAFFGGYTFAMDLRNERTSRNAFEAFTESQCLRPPIMDGTCFRPDLPYGAIVENEGRKRANIWWPANVRRAKGDPTPFLRHLAKLLPVPHDQEITLYYMAGCVQYPGHKFQWFPLLIGTEGNGKSLLSRCVAYAVGQRYTHWPDASKLGSQFNGWVFGKVFAAIEDMNIGDSAEVWEKLKPLVTGENIEVESKGVDQRTDEVCVNFMANSNHKGAHKATANDRRVAHLWTAQQSANDLVRDGMTDDYMSKLYDWLKLQDGFAIVAEYLHTLPIPPQYGLNWLKGRAPRTSSTADAIAAALGPAEQEIQDCVERGEIGFRGGWVSSHFLDKMLQRIGRDKAIPINKRKDLMATLGYTWHPALPQGRSNGTLLPDGVKSKLFVLSARPDLLALGASEAAKRYGQDQGAA